MKPIIEVHQLGKKYRLGESQPYVTLRDSLASILHNPLSLANSSSRDSFWALRDVNFEVMPGEVLGIIGRNGAGKSTLLKILSRITPPTEGKAILRGRVGSLLEVGTGFQAELTGRENIFLNGAILGMKQVEIKRKFDEIVAFAEVEQFLDTPLKHYSSGMYMRLAFAVAAHLEPEILIVDEVLAVGDTNFQKKALGKMDQVTREEGRTVLFVSHNLNAISQLCKRTLVLASGKKTYLGETWKAIKKYSDIKTDIGSKEWSGSAGNESVLLKKTWISSKTFFTKDEMEIGIEIEVLKPVRDLVLGYKILSEFGYELIYSLFDDFDPNPVQTHQAGKLKKVFKIPANVLTEGNYTIEFEIALHSIGKIVDKEGSLSFSLLIDGQLGKRFITDQIRGLTSLIRPNWPVR